MITLKAAREAQGIGSDNLEDPLPDGTIEQLDTTFSNYYHFSLSDNEMLCESLLGKIKRYIDRTSHELIKCEYVRTMREMARTSVGRKLRMGDLTVNVPNSAITKSARPVSSNYVYIFLLEVLLCGGFAVVGCFMPAGKTEMFAPLHEIREYVAMVKRYALPLTGKQPPLERIVRSDEDTRSLWNKCMRKGQTLGEAIRTSEPKMAAYWLWACDAEAQEEREIINQLQEKGTSAA